MNASSILESEHDALGGTHLDAYAVVGGRLVPPAPHGGGRRRVEAEVRLDPAQQLDVLHGAVFVDQHFQEHRPGNALALGKRRVGRWRAVDRLWRYDVAAQLDQVSLPYRG